MPPPPDRLPLGFAHRGGRHRGVPPQSLESIRRSLELGADGIEADLWVTSDGHAVVLHPKVPRPGSVARRPRSALPAAVPDLEAVYRLVGGDTDIALDTAAPAAAEHAVALAREHGAEDHLWLTYWRIEQLAAWRRMWPDVRLVFPSLILPWRRPLALLDRLADAGVDALNIHARQASPALVRASHERGLLLFAWGARDRAAPERVLAAGCDGVFADDVPAMVAAIRRRR
jgi:glycerophosphoryl diester phosphodiesterase